MRLTILGSGTCVPSLERSACSALIQTADQNLLCDAGPGTMRRLLEAGVSIFDISVIFFSHFHPDHTGELAPFLFSTKYPDGTLRKRPLTLIGGSGFADFHHRLKAVYGRWIDLDAGLIDIIELDSSTTGMRRFQQFSVEHSPVRHNPESLAYRITGSHGKSIVYSGDTDFSEGLISLAHGADILVCESAMPDDLKVPGHMTPSEAGETAARAGVGKLVLTHFYPECDTADVEGQCRRTWDGSLVLAKDLMAIEAEG